MDQYVQWLAVDYSRTLTLLLKDLVVAFIQFIIAQMRIALCHLNIAMPCQFLCKFEIT